MSPANTPKITAPTSGLEDVYFMWGTAKDAAKFKDTVRKLTWHVGTCPWTQSLVASKSMSTLVTSEFEEPAVPAGEYWADPGSTVKTNNRTRPGTGDEVADSPPVTEDWKHNLEGEEYKTKRKVYNDQVLAWRENKTKCYHLVLSHCPRALEHQLKNSSKWEETEGNLDVVALLKMIRDTTHKKGEEGKRDDNRGERRGALHDPPDLPRQILQGFQGTG